MEFMEEQVLWVVLGYSLWRNKGLEYVVEVVVNLGLFQNN